MKRNIIKILIICTIMMAAFFNLNRLVNAGGSLSSSLSTNKTNVKHGENVVITINMSGLTNGLGSANYTVTFDNTLFTYVSTSWPQSPSGFHDANLFGGNQVKLAFASSTPINNGGFASITFTAKQNVSGSGTFGLTGNGFNDKDSAALTSSFTGINSNVYIPSTNANLTGLSVSAGTLSPSFKEDVINYNVSTEAASITINATGVAGATVSGAGLKNLAYGNNTFNIVVTAEAGNTKTYTIVVSRPDNRSTDNKLKSLTVSSGSISFNPTTTNYTVNLDSSVSSFKVTGVANDSKSKVTYNPGQTVNLDYGQTQAINIVVTAENGSQKTYKVTATRKDDRSSNNKLKTLTVSNTDIKLGDSLSYSTTVENKITFVDIAATAEDSKATVIGNGKRNLNVGSNNYTIEVIAENGSKKLYTITIIRKDESGKIGDLSSNNNLKSLTIDGIKFEFNKETLTYNIGVENTVNEVKINYESEDPKSTVVVQGDKSLKVGINKILISVTSEDGKSKIYQLFIKRDELKTIIQNDKEIIINKSKTDDDIIVKVLSTDNKTIVDNDILKTLKDNKKTIVYEVINDMGGLLYSVEFVGENISKNTPEINIGLTFKTNNKNEINSLIGESDPLYLNFAHSGELPKGTKFKVFVGDKFEDNKKLHLYYYNEKSNKMEYIDEELIVKDGYVEFSIDHCSEYILVDNIIKGINNNPIILYIIIFSLIVITTVGIVFFIKHKSNLKLNKTDEQNVDNHNNEVEIIDFDQEKDSSLSNNIDV